MSDPQNKSVRWIAAAVTFSGLILTLLWLFNEQRPKGGLVAVEGYMPWAPETLAIAETLPVQSGGRIKPLSSHAGFIMLGLHGQRTMKFTGESGKTHKIRPTEWMLDALFRPQLAIHQPTFRIDNSDVLEAIGMPVKSRRDRYSYADIEPGRGKLVELARTYEEIDRKQRDPVQQQTIDLAYNLRNYESLLGYFGFARSGVRLTGSGRDGAPDQRADISTVMLTAPQIRAQISQTQADGGAIHPHIKGLLEQVLDAANFAKYGLFILPPGDKADPTWQSAGDTIMAVMTSQSEEIERAVTDIKAMETATRALDESEAAFREKLTVLRDDLKKRAEARGEYRAIPMEVAYYNKDWFFRAMLFFLGGTLTALAMWAAGGGLAGRLLARATFGFTFVGLVLCVIAMVKRSMIMERPPVGNLYDTIIFIGTTGVFLALVIEWMVGRRFALGLAPILGVALFFLSGRFETGDASDHMDPLVAVLDSNFWLATHVTTITLGYSAGLLAAVLSCGYLLIRGLGLDGGDQDLRRALSRAVYGSICLTLFLSLVGTVLGGIWANYSWGRFWGWDPKENGALMIVIWTLAILHARLGGYIREWGLHLASVFTACIVVFSWWHVNFLGVGLHNYGFTAGKSTIWFFYGVMMLFIIFGFIAMLVDMQARQAADGTTDSNRSGGEPVPPT
jgi:ABC-type transport system involved in cytochrome c biogenesis permease subunit